MNLARVWENLNPGAAERDDAFREYLAALAHDGVRALGLVEMAAAAAFALARAAEGWGGAAALFAIGAVTLAAARAAWSRRRPRLAAGVSLLLAAGAWIAPSGGSDPHISTGVALLVLSSVAIVPFRPLQILALGATVEAMYIFSVWAGATAENAPAGAAANHAFILMATLLSTGVAAGNYRGRRLEQEARGEAVRVAEALTGAQLRAQLAESAISIGKLAAALTHEINSPLGALRSSIDTLLAATDRQIAAPPEGRAALEETRASLAGSIRESAARIDQVMARLRRFVNLEEAELKSADVNELLGDVALLHQHEWENRLRLEFDLQPAPPLTCRPQLLTAVFSTLLRNAIQAVDHGGLIVVRTRREPEGVAVSIEDNGRGMSAEQVETLFDPSFRVAGSRVASGNWSLFNTRQILYEHGGEIAVASEVGRGTTVRVTLPV